MSKRERRAGAGRAVGLVVLTALALLLTLGQAPAARAQWAQPSGSNNIHNTNAGNVGVGTPSPTYRLHVAGDNTEAGGFPLIKLENTQAGGRSWWFYSGAFGVPGALGIYDQAAGSYRMFFDPAGGLGVGTTSPLAGAKVDVYAGNSALPSDFGAAALVSRKAYDPWTNAGATSTGILGAASASYNSQTLNGVYGYANSGGSASAVTTGVRGFGHDDQNTHQPGAVSGGVFTGKAHISQYGNKSVSGVRGRGELVGTLGHASNVAYGGVFEAVNSTGQAGTAYAVYASATGAGTNYGVYSAAGKNFFGDSVGVGTNSPAYRLDVQGGQINASGGLCIAGDCKVSWSQVSGGAGGTQWTTAGANIHYAAGNVGVGTSAPQKALHVVGDVKATGDLDIGGNITAKFQDLAEWVPSTQKLAAGTVVVLDPSRANHVLACAAAYDTSVAGVVSAQPGIILGEGGEGRVMVATTGRVRVRVDATKAPIRIGDLLVTSGVEGVAMRSEAVSLGGVTIHRPGTIIGKALESLEKGTGEILVLLSMQ